MQPLQNCIGPTIRIGREILCLPYAGFFFSPIKKFVNLLILSYAITHHIGPLGSGELRANIVLSDF